MYYDESRGAYVDRDTGDVVFVDEESQNAPIVEVITPTTGSSKKTKSKKASTSKTNDYYLGIVAKPSSTEVKAPDGNDSEAARFERMFEMAVLENQRSPGATQLEDDLYNIHVSDGYEAVNPALSGVAGAPLPGSSTWEDWNFARTLQSLEFEIDADAYYDDGQSRNEHEDFERKEYRASRSCRRQLATISFFICLIQLAFMVAMIQIAGYAPNAENPMIGPPVYIMVRFGAKQAALIVYDGQWWRLLSSVFVHAGIFHIIPNVAIQLRVGGYLNLVYGTPRWLAIYLISGIFGEILSCLFLPDSVGVGSSGALMGMLSSWVVWILVRWERIPPQCRGQRNCQLMVVAASIVVTLATSATPNVDWAAHLGGAIGGVLLGLAFLGDMGKPTLIEGEGLIEQQQWWQPQSFYRQWLTGRGLLRTVPLLSFILLFILGIWYMAVKLNPSRADLPYFAQNDDWGR